MPQRRLTGIALAFVSGVLFATLPIFFRVLHAAAFLDAGHAWTDTARWSDRSIAIGAELALDGVIGYVLPVTVAGGVAWRQQGRGGVRDTALFGRIGRAF